jgi:hypothetical protein
MSIGWNPFYANKEKTAEPWILHEFDKVRLAGLLTGSSTALVQGNGLQSALSSRGYNMSCSLHPTLLWTAAIRRPSVVELPWHPFSHSSASIQPLCLARNPTTT